MLPILKTIHRVMIEGTDLIHTPEYEAWHGMVRRCTYPKDISYRNYGARGIKVCKRWRNGEGGESGFWCFFHDLGPRPSPDHSIDRVNNNGDYETSNVRWASAKEQGRNRRTNVMIEHEGERLILKDALAKIGKDHGSYFNHRQQGLSPQEAFDRILESGWRRQYVLVDGRRASLMGALKAAGCSHGSYHYHRSRGLSVQAAFDRVTALKAAGGRVPIQHDGRTLTITEALTAIGASYGSYDYQHRKGVSPQAAFDALITLKRSGHARVKIVLRGNTLPLMEALRAINVGYPTYNYHRKKGLSPQEAFDHVALSQKSHSTI